MIRYSERMTPWITQSNPSKQALYAAISVVLGALLLVGVLFSGSRGENALAGGLLGAMMLVIGVVGALYTGKQTVTVDPHKRQIVVQDARVLGAKTRAIAFGDVGHVGIGYIGKKSNYVNFYYLVLRLRTGEEYPLFAPGRGFDGASHRETVDGWRCRLDEYLRVS